MNTIRTLQRVIPGQQTSDGAGVKLRRSLGQGARLDPFLMLDEFSSDNPGDYIAGFPPHPHRGFETVTYMLDGHMRHEDHLGNVGELKSGGVQWMTAGRGIIHSEMPLQEQGRLRGFQLWINLPAREKMKSAGYRDIPAEQIPEATLEHGGSVKVIAGRARLGERAVEGPVQGISTEPLYFDVRLPAGARFSHPLPQGHAALIYVYEGAVAVGEGESRLLRAQQAGVLSDGNALGVQARQEEARFLLIAAKPLHEPIAQYGPFVMNTPEEIQQAISDYQNGRLAAPAM